MLWFVLKWFTVLVCDGGTLWLIFLPKAILLWRHKDGKMDHARQNFVSVSLDKLHKAASRLSQHRSPGSRRCRSSDAASDAMIDTERVLDSSRASISSDDERSLRASDLPSPSKKGGARAIVTTLEMTQSSAI